MMHGEYNVKFHIIITVHLHESNETKLNQLMHKLSHLYCSVLIMPLHMFRTLVHHQGVCLPALSAVS